MKNLSLKSKITFVFVCLVIILTAFIAYFTLSFFEEKIKSDISYRQYVMVSALADEFDDKLRTTHNLLVQLSGIVTPDLALSPDRAREFLNGRKEILSIFDNGLFLFDISGRIIAETPVTPNRVGKDFSFREYFKITVESGSPYIGNPYRSTHSRHDPAVMFTAPVRDGKGKMIAVLGGSLSLLKDNFLGRLRHIKIGGTGYMYLYSMDRTMVVHPDASRILENDIPVGVNKLLDQALDGFEGTGETVNSRGPLAITTFKRLKSKNWLLAANYPVAEAYEPIVKAKKTLLVAIIIMTVCVLVVGRFIVSYFMRSLSLFTKHIVQLPNKSDEAKLFQVTYDDEIGKMAGAFNTMVKELESERMALKSEKERLAVTLRSIGDGVITTDVGENIFLMNTVAENLTGWTQKEAFGRHLSDVFRIIDEKTGECRETPVDKVIKSGKTVELENHTVLIARDGTERIIADNSAPIMDRDGKIIGVVLVFRDMTEKNRLEEELLKAQKLESLGILAGGIAHDFNNLLTAILGNISLINSGGMSHDDKKKRLEDAEKATLRAKDLAYQLLTFSKGGAPIKKTASITDIIKDSSGFLLRGSNIRCEYDFHDGLWPLEVDQGQINQVINNLIINSTQAMPEGGTVSISARNFVMRDDNALKLRHGKYVVISVRDTGPGIPAEYISRVFDPFFTTKKEGSGLGLCISYSIIKKHDGHISVESKPDAGTLFNIYLPASSQDISETKDSADRIRCGNGKILFMDDEELIRELAAGMLKVLGYDFELTKDGREVLEAYKKASDTGASFDAVIMDMTIPGGMGGRETVISLQEMDPSVKAIVSSGYSNHPVLSDYKEYGFSGVLIKPYTVKDLGEALNKVFN
ncbi:MAG: PAS domain-containing protein [Nitrospirae bacterium]|nr:PAS domain-containing protein [Nitrospirota bacterium]